MTWATDDTPTQPIPVIPVFDLYPHDPVPTQPLPPPPPYPALPAAALVAPGTISGGWVWNGQQWVPLPRNRRSSYPLGRTLTDLAGDRWWLAVPLAAVALVALVWLWITQYVLLFAVWSVLLFLMLFWRNFYLGFRTQQYFGTQGSPGSSLADAWLPWVVWG